ncbi:MAG: M56 family metallopeptidase, partial [Gemmatimonadaceae bacterium]
CTIYWFNPLAWLAARTERVTREQACDDAVLRCGSRPSTYAQQLLEVAHGDWPNTLAVAALTMASRSSIARRLRAILDVAPDRSPTGRGLSSVALGAVCVLVPPLAAVAPEWVGVAVNAAPNEFVVTLPPPSNAPSVSEAVRLPTSAAAPHTAPMLAAAQQTTDCVPSSGKRSSTSIQSSDSDSPSRRRWHVKWSDASCRIELDARGTFTLSPNADDVVALSSGGYFELLYDDGRLDRRVRLERGDGGSLERTYWVNGRREPWNADAGSWFARTLVALDRRTAFAVDTRLPMLLQRGGVEAVMDEVAQMPSTYPQRVYFTKLFERQKLSAEQLIRVLETASRNFDSDYEKAELLLRVAKQPAFAEPVHLAFAQMARGIKSDYEKRRGLGALLVRDDLKPEVVGTMLQATEDMKSDYELAELLLGIDRRYAADESTRQYYVRALSTIESDYEQRRVLTAIMRSGALSAAATGEVIAIAGRTMKGYELAEFLVEISSKGSLDQTTSTAFFNATKNVNSDYERRRVLEALLRKGQLNREVVEGI